MKNISIGSDHAGYGLKSQILLYLKERGYRVTDEGTHSEERADYPDFAHAVAKSIEKGESEIGILICGSANGISMAANKHQGIRCAVCWRPEIAALAKQHNDANIIALPARFIEVDEAKKCVQTFLESSFEGGRHALRVDKIHC